MRSNCWIHLQTSYYSNLWSHIRRQIPAYATGIRGKQVNMYQALNFQTRFLFPPISTGLASTNINSAGVEIDAVNIGAMLLWAY